MTPKIEGTSTSNAPGRINTNGGRLVQWREANQCWCIGKPILVPLTTSLYVPGTLADHENVIVDVGTGFYVEKVRNAQLRQSPMLIWTQSTKDATKFYEAKVEELGSNLKDLEAIVQGKSNNLRVVEDGKSHVMLEREHC